MLRGDKERLEEKSQATVIKTKEQDGDGEKALWGPSFSSTSGPDISELISHAGVVCVDKSIIPQCTNHLRNERK